MARCGARPRSSSASRSGLPRYPWRPPLPSLRQTPRASRSSRPRGVVHARMRDDRSTGCLEVSSKALISRVKNMHRIVLLCKKPGLSCPKCFPPPHYLLFYNTFHEMKTLCTHSACQRAGRSLLSSSLGLHLTCCMRCYRYPHTTPSTDSR
jgi:hypothetical protein